MEHTAADSRMPSDGPAVSAIAVNVSSVDQTFATHTRGIWVGAGGNLACRFRDDSADVTITGLLPGFYPFSLQLIRHTSTTAANMVAFF